MTGQRVARILFLGQDAPIAPVRSLAQDGMDILALDDQVSSFVGGS